MAGQAGELPGALDVHRTRSSGGSARRTISVAVGTKHEDASLVIQPGGVRKLLQLMDGNRKAAGPSGEEPDGSMRKARPPVAVARAASSPGGRCAAATDGLATGVRAMLKREVIDSHVKLPDGTTPRASTGVHVAARAVTPRNFIAVTPREIAPLRMKPAAVEDTPSQEHPGPGAIGAHPRAKTPDSPDMLLCSDGPSFAPFSCSAVWAPLKGATCVLPGHGGPALSSGVQAECKGLVGRALAMKWESSASGPVQCSRSSSSSGTRRSNRDVDEEELSACSTPFSTWRSYGTGHADTQPCPGAAATNRDGQASPCAPRSHGWSTTFTKLEQVDARVCPIDERALSVKLARIHKTTKGAVGKQQARVLWCSPARGLTDNTGNYQEHSFSARARSGGSLRASTSGERAAGASSRTVKSMLDTRVTYAKKPEQDEELLSQSRRSCAVAPLSTPSSSSTAIPRTSRSQISVGATSRTVGHGLPPTVPCIIQATPLSHREDKLRHHPVQIGPQQRKVPQLASAPEACAPAPARATGRDSPGENYLHKDYQMGATPSASQERDIEIKLSGGSDGPSLPWLEGYSYQVHPATQRALHRNGEVAFSGSGAAAGERRQGSGAGGAKRGALALGAESIGVAWRLRATASKPARDEVIEVVRRHDERLRTADTGPRFLC